MHGRDADDRSCIVQSGRCSARRIWSFEIPKPHQSVAAIFHLQRTKALPLAFDFPLNRRQPVVSLVRPRGCSREDRGDEPEGNGDTSEVFVWFHLYLGTGINSRR